MSLLQVANIKGTAIYGALAGSAFIAANSLNSNFAIGWPYAITNTLLVVVLIAPILEEIFFRGIVQRVAEIIFKNIWIAAIVQAGLFSLFHFTAYGGSLATVTTPFIGALVFGLAMTALSKYSNSLVPGMIAHGIFNFWLVKQFLLSIGVPV